MKAIHTALAVAALFAMGVAQASEITEFAPAASMQVSRDEVRAEAKAANDAGRLRYDFTGPAVTPMSMKTRDEVRGEVVSRPAADAVAASFFVGGM
jgi:hypothetical protein